MSASRALSTGVLVALLLSSWSNVIAAAFCPRYFSNRDCCVKQPSLKPGPVDTHLSCHHEMPDMPGMQMDDTPMETDDTRDSKSDYINQALPQSTFESSTDQVAFDLPIEQCAHCWSHSQPTSGSVTVAGADLAKRLVETDSPSGSLSVTSLSTFPMFIAPSEHGPPGISLPRHVLINVFRI